MQKQNKSESVCFLFKNSYENKISILHHGIATMNLPPGNFLHLIVLFILTWLEGCLYQTGLLDVSTF
jgi:hypothetical protein